MDLKTYQAFTKDLAVYNTALFAEIRPPFLTNNDEIFEDMGYVTVHDEPMQYLYPVLALAEEAGEVAGKVAKYIRKGDTDYQSLRVAVKAELGDVLYQLSECARQFDWTLDEVLDGNVEKLTDRKERGVICADGGDNR